jgi:hypothetical protein
MNPAQVVIESDRLDVVCFKEFLFVHVCFRMMDTAQADGEESCVDDRLAVSAVGTDSIHMVDLTRLTADSALAMLDAMVHIPADVIRSQSKRFLQRDSVPQDKVDEIVEEVMCLGHGAIGEGERFLFGLKTMLPH